MKLRTQLLLLPSVPLLVQMLVIDISMRITGGLPDSQNINPTSLVLILTTLLNVFGAIAAACLISNNLRKRYGIK